MKKENILKIFHKKKDLESVKNEIMDRIPVEGDKDYQSLLKYLKPFIPYELQNLYCDVIFQSKLYERAGVIENKEYEKIRDTLFNSLGFGTGYSEEIESNWFDLSEIKLTENKKNPKFVISNFKATNEEANCEFREELKRQQEEQEKIELEEQEKQKQFEQELEKKWIEPAKTLPYGWNWICYSDGSGYLESPDGEQYMHYDLWTNEYQETINSKYDFFPLNFYYIDGVDPSEFDAFEYMETEVKEKYLKEENKENEEVYTL